MYWPNMTKSKDIPGDNLTGRILIDMILLKIDIAFDYDVMSFYLKRLVYLLIDVNNLYPLDAWKPRMQPLRTIYI